MSRAARTSLVFAIYLAVLGTTLIVVPNLLLQLFGFAPTQEVWIRVVGMLVLILGFYYLEAARHEWTGFLRASVPARMSVIVFFAAFVVLGFVQPALLLFGAVDFVAAVWTAWALRADWLGAKR